ncbi:MAG TPA: DUF2231 domain-containing protein [Actinoplanes sp.]|nr:DUF2231 domain-containing protein [Actinoplanes sp.]
MFDQINGLPVHALVNHAAVVFGPLLVLGAIVYAVVPRWRPRIGWAVLLLAVVAPVTTYITMESGKALRDRLFEQGVSGRGAEIINEHMDLGTVSFWLMLALGVLSLVMVLLTLRPGRSLPRAADLGMAVIMVVLAAVSGYYVFKTGDSGATAVWGTY